MEGSYYCYSCLTGFVKFWTTGASAIPPPESGRPKILISTEYDIRESTLTALAEVSTTIRTPASLLTSRSTPDSTTSSILLEMIYCTCLVNISKILLFYSLSFNFERNVHSHDNYCIRSIKIIYHVERARLN